MPAPDSAAPTLPRIHPMRGLRVMLDHDLAALYGVPTKVFNQTIQRNIGRVPADFVFQLTREELAVSTGSISPGPSPSTAPLWPPLSSAARAPSR